jgi:hypothetical protein
MRENEEELSEEELTIRDAITAEILKAFKLEVIPLYDAREVTYHIHGDVDTVLQKIAANTPIGSRDVLEAIKTCRSAIFLFKQGVRK